MNKSKLLTAVVIALLTINIMTLTFFIIKKPNDVLELKINKSPKEIVIKKLHFDANQILKYDSLIEIHKNSVRKLDQNIRMYKNNIYATLAKEENNKTIDSLFFKLTNSQLAIEKIHYQHFLDIKQICKKDQMVSYESLTEELSQIFNAKTPPRNQKREHHN